MSKNNNEYKSLRLGVDPPFVSKLAKQTYHENLKPHLWENKPKIGSVRQRWSYFAFEKKDRITVILLVVRFVCMTRHRADGVYLTMTLKVSGIYGLMFNGMIFVVGIS